MKNVNTLIKKNFGSFIFLFNLLLSVIGIIASIFSLKTENFENPFLKVLPISSVLWMFFAFFAKKPQEKMETEEEIKLSSLKYSPFNIIICIFSKIIITICILIVFTCFFMTIFIAGKIDISRNGSLHPLIETLDMFRNN